MVKTVSRVETRFFELWVEHSALSMPAVQVDHYEHCAMCHMLQMIAWNVCLVQSGLQWTRLLPLNLNCFLSSKGLSTPPPKKNGSW